MLANGRKKGFYREHFYLDEYQDSIEGNFYFITYFRNKAENFRS